MNTDTVNRLKNVAPFVEKFRNLSPDEQEWLEPMLKNNLKTALDILDTITDSPMTYQAIATTLQLHPTTVTQMLNALAEGGCRIDLKKKTAFAPVGRPRTLARR